ncbi:MAG TPA: TRL domain-containing protein [Nitrospirota bacterium]|nr:TRL domain-containing protein [Nitrospirota bacterium]
MKPFRLIMILLVLLLLLSGCLYVHTREPLTLDMHRTPVANVEKEGSIKLITFPPFTGDYKLIAWGTAAIGDVAKKEGMQEVYYADLEIFSVLRVWNEYTVHVYGK